MTEFYSAEDWEPDQPRQERAKIKVTHPEVNSWNIPRAEIRVTLCFQNDNDFGKFARDFGTMRADGSVPYLYLAWKGIEDD